LTTIHIINTTIDSYVLTIEKYSLIYNYFQPAIGHQLNNENGKTFLSLRQITIVEWSLIELYLDFK